MGVDFPLPKIKQSIFGEALHFGNCTAKEYLKFVDSFYACFCAYFWLQGKPSLLLVKLRPLEGHINKKHFLQATNLKIIQAAVTAKNNFKALQNETETDKETSITTGTVNPNGPPN